MCTIWGMLKMIDSKFFCNKFWFLVIVQKRKTQPKWLLRKQPKPKKLGVLIFSTTQCTHFKFVVYYVLCIVSILSNHKILIQFFLFKSVTSFSSATQRNPNPLNSTKSVVIVMCSKHQGLRLQTKVKFNIRFFTI